MKLLVLACLIGLAAAAPSANVGSADPWWKNGVIYQLYPRSFMDSDGNGVGDIKGIMTKVQYLKDLGVSAVWFNPMYPSGDADFGYDVNDFKSIDKLFGTMDDLDKLIKALHDAGIKVIMDMVPNHTSDKHKWFLSSSNPSDKDYEKYKDYYIWMDKPNNWLSVTGGSAWTCSKSRKQYYLHNFFKGQPDLNYRNTDVIKDMLDVIKFWLDKNVDGFRMDAVSWLVEDSSFANESLIIRDGCQEGSTDYSCYDHSIRTELPDTYEIIQKYADTVNNSQNMNRVIFTESYADDISKIMKYYEQKVTFPMNMRIIQYASREYIAKDWVDRLKEWNDNYKNELKNWNSPNWILGNHDQHRIGSRLWREMGDALNMLLMVLKGTAITYNGEELVMMDGPVRWDQAQDQQGKFAGQYNYYKVGRDGERTPMQWNTSTSAGFSSKIDPWLPANPDYVWNNQEGQANDGNSHLNIYKKVVKLKSHPTLKNGDQTIETSGDNVFYVKRYDSSNKVSTVVLAINVGETEIKINPNSMGIGGDVYIYTVSSHNAQLLPQGKLEKNKSIVLTPKAGVIFSNEEIKF